MILLMTILQFDNFFFQSTTLRLLSKHGFRTACTLERNSFVSVCVPVCVFNV